MKKAIPYIASVVCSAAVTFFFFEAMSWYHFGDIPTRVVLLRLLFVWIVLSALLCISIALLCSKGKKK